MAYKLELSASASIHPVFHVFQLKKALGDGVHSQPLPPLLDAELEWMVEPEKVLAVRQSATNSHTGQEVLIKWKDLLDFEASWELVDIITKQFPDFHLEDKVSLGTGGIDRPPIRITYSRRKRRQNAQGE